MSVRSYDVAVIGAGVAGLAACAVLQKAGQRVVCLEAAGRVGGRILTVRDPQSPLPIELGAEFVHGRPPEIWTLIQQNGLTAYEHTSRALYLDAGRIVNQDGELTERVLRGLERSTKLADESFADYLQRSRQPEVERQWARLQIEGFNAARQEVIGAESLRKDAAASAKIEGDRGFKILSGYDAIPMAQLQAIEDHSSVVHLNAQVERIEWKRGSVDLRSRSTMDQSLSRVKCRQVIVTVPLGVLQARTIHFDPVPPKILAAADGLRFGQVYRLTFRFREAFWAEEGRFEQAGFLLSQDPAFFAWWTAHPVMAPLLTGWSAGSAADQFRGRETGNIVSEALASLGRILKRKVPRPEAVYFHDWQADRLFQGAYSYAPVNGLAARRALAKPVENTLFFAGEAAHAAGHASTVHGAIATGIRAAELALANGASANPSRSSRR